LNSDHNHTDTHIGSLTRALKQKALELGFSQAGIAAAQTLDHEMGLFQEWLDRGYHGSLSYMERNLDKRRDPENILPGARSVVVLTYNYFTPFYHDCDSAGSESHGKISRYAWGDDYHEVIPPKLQQLSDFLKELSPGAGTKYYTDTGAVLEKPWAVRAGIGWQGKHSNVISRTNGSWFFLAVIITDVELEPDTPHLDYCGSCTACMKACPTSAIVEPYVVDATKCISYWTIETKPEFEIPDAIADNMNGWIFGCDICQEVCPWNRFRKISEEPGFFPRENETCLEFRRIEEFTQEDFSARFRKSPLKRTKLPGLKRNIRAMKKKNSP